MWANAYQRIMTLVFVSTVVKCLAKCVVYNCVYPLNVTVNKYWFGLPETVAEEGCIGS